MMNSSGFHGYSIASLYPDWGTGVSDLMTTIPDVEEQESYTAQEPDQKARPAVGKEYRKQVWVMLLLMIGVVLLFAKA